MPNEEHGLFKHLDRIYKTKFERWSMYFWLAGFILLVPGVMPWVSAGQTAELGLIAMILFAPNIVILHRKNKELKEKIRKLDTELIVIDTVGRLLDPDWKGTEREAAEAEVAKMFGGKK